MHAGPYNEPKQERQGLPWWVLLAAAPLVLALGFVGGVMLWAYHPARVVESPPAGQGKTVAVAPQQPGDPAPHSPSPSPPQQTAQPAVLPQSPGTTRTSPTLPQAVDQPLPFVSRTPGRHDGTASSAGPGSGPGANTQPATVYGRPEVRTLVEARAVLSTEYGAFSIDGRKLFSVDYQRARDANYNVVLIGIVKIADYAEWVRASRDHQRSLEAWLTAAALRIRPAALSERFTLTWTIYETVSDPPYGFASKEVTPDPRGGGYVVTRALAAVTDMAGPVISLALPPSPTRPSSADSPWAAYGPVIRFDPTDLYRPARTSTKP